MIRDQTIGRVGGEPFPSIRDHYRFARLLVRKFAWADSQPNVVLIISDDQGWADYNRDAARSKRTPSEGGVRTPIMISWPGKVAPRLDTEHLASTVDLWPTLSSLLGTEDPVDLTGIDLTDDEAVKSRTAVFGQQYNHDIASVDEPTRSLEHRWIIAGDWKLIVLNTANLPDAKPELYNVKQDPQEANDVAKVNPDRVVKLLSQLDQWWTASAKHVDR